MSREHGSRSRRSVAAVFGVAFAFAFAALVVAQLTLMSVLDLDRAESAAQEVAESRLTGELIDDTVRATVGPLLDPALTDQVAVIARNDPQVRDIVRTSLIAAHRQIVVPGAPDAASESSARVDAAIASVLADAGTQSGVDLSAVTGQIATSEVVPPDLPTIGLRDVAERTRLIAAALALVAAVVAVGIHPRSGRALAGLGWKAALVCAVWGLGLLAVGWFIGLASETLFGELLSAVWSSAVPAMLSVLGAGALLGAGTWLGGISLDGLTRGDRRTRVGGPRHDRSRARFEHPERRVPLPRTVHDERSIHVDPVPLSRRVHRDSS